MFQRLCIHVIQRLRPVHAHLYLQPGMEDGYIQVFSLFFVVACRGVQHKTARFVFMNSDGHRNPEAEKDLWLCVTQIKLKCRDKGGIGRNFLGY